MSVPLEEGIGGKLAGPVETGIKQVGSVTHNAFVNSRHSAMGTSESGVTSADGILYIISPRRLEGVPPTPRERKPLERGS